MKSKILAAALISLIITAGCGYRHGFGMPKGAEDVKTVAIDIFIDRTLRPELAEAFALELQREIAAKTELKIVDHDQADAIIRGSVDSYDRVVIREFRNDDVARYSIIVTASYRLVRPGVNGKPEQIIKAGERIRYSAEYETAMTDETTARNEAVKRAAREVVSNIFEEW